MTNTSKKTSNNNSGATCTACGQAGGEDGLKTCTACRAARYCNRSCQLADRPRHKRACKEMAAALLEEKLFAQPPVYDDCPICFLLLPLENAEHQYVPCCGKTICGGCFYVIMMDKKLDMLCPMCRGPLILEAPEHLALLLKRAKANDKKAVFQLASHYNRRQAIDLGLPQNHAKAMEMWMRAGKLGHKFTAHTALAFHDFWPGLAILKIFQIYHGRSKR